MPMFDEHDPYDKELKEQEGCVFWLAVFAFIAGIVAIGVVIFAAIDLAYRNWG